MRLKVYRIIERTTAEGPGIRFCIWVQGCPIRCIGCAVPETWDENGGMEYEIDVLAAAILSDPDLEGVTFVGGEPFAQAEALTELAILVRQAGLSVVTFTGYNLQHIKEQKNPAWETLLNESDLLIDGPYMRNRGDMNRPWVGSSNQNYHFLSERYTHLEKTLGKIHNKIEIRIGPDGTISVNGMAELKTLEELISG